jgi:trigger factor
MQVTETLSDGLKRGYKIVVDAAEIARQVDSQLEEVGKQVKMPGFRPGKVPASVVRQRYGKSILGDVVQTTIRTQIQTLLTERNLRPSLEPDVEVKEFAEGDNLEFSLSFEVFPEIPAVALETVSINRPVFEVPAEEIEEGLQRLASRNRKFEPQDAKYKAKEGDVVIIDFIGKRDDVAFPGGTAEGFRLELGSGQFIEGFEAGLVGAKAGESRELQLRFPEEYHNSDLAGQPVTFSVTVKEVQKGAEAKVDDEFAQSIGFENLEGIRNAIKTHLEGEYGSIVRTRLKKELFDRLDELVGFELPQKMVELEFESIWQRLQEARTMGDPSLEGKTDDELKAEYRKIAERRVKLGLLLSDIGAKNNIRVANEEINRAVIQQARQYPGQEQRVIEFYRKNPAHLEDLRGPLFEDKVVDYVLTQVKLTDKQISVEELLNEEGDAAEASEGKAKKPAAKKAKPAKAEGATEEEATEKKTRKAKTAEE